MRIFRGKEDRQLQLWTSVLRYYNHSSLLRDKLFFPWSLMIFKKIQKVILQQLQLFLRYYQNPQTLFHLDGNLYPLCCTAKLFFKHLPACNFVHKLKNDGSWILKINLFFKSVSKKKTNPSSCLFCVGEKVQTCSCILIIWNNRK